MVSRLPAEQDDVQCDGEDGDDGPDDAEYPDVDFVVVLSCQQGLVDECNEACCDGEHQYVEE